MALSCFSSFSILFFFYLGLPVLTKYFVIFNCLCPEEGLNFCFVYLYFGPLLHLQYMNIHIQNFSKSCRYGKYYSFETLITHVTVLGAEKFLFPCKSFFFAELQLKMFWPLAETKNTLCLGDRVSQERKYYLTSFKEIGSLIEKYTLKTCLLLCWPHSKSAVFLFVCFSSL